MSHDLRAGSQLEGVPEAGGVGVGEEEGPGLAAVGGLVEAGLVAGAAGHDDGGVLVEGLDAAEVELFGAGRGGAVLPHVAAVLGADDRAVRAAGPGDAAADVVDAAQVGGGGRVEELPLGLGLGGEREEQGEGGQGVAQRCGIRCSDGASACVHRCTFPLPRT